jgi:ubiquitin-conjugating enzyme E2 J1
MNPLLEEWHCTLRGPIGTEFEGGLYHFRILLPAEYPFRPPSLMMLTPNGRFELNTKVRNRTYLYGLLLKRVELFRYASVLPAVRIIGNKERGHPSSCHSDHEELWQPAWGVRTGKLPAHLPHLFTSNTVLAAILGLHSFFPLKGQAAVGVGSIETPIAERKRLATLCVVL